MNLEVHSQAPAGWQRWAIEPLREPSIHQSGKMLNPPERTLPLLPHLQPFITTSIPSVSPVSVFSFPPPQHSNLHQKHRRNILLPVWCVAGVDGCGAEMMLFRPLALFLCSFCLFFKLTSFYILTSSSVNHPQPLSGGKNPPHILSQIRWGGGLNV